jgi:hypothetical protein
MLQTGRASETKGMAASWQIVIQETVIATGGHRGHNRWWVQQRHLGPGKMRGMQASRWLVEDQGGC